MSNSERRVGAQINTAPKSPDSVVRFPFWEKRLTRRQAGQTAGGVGLGIVSALHGARRAWAQEASVPEPGEPLADEDAQKTGLFLGGEELLLPSSIKPIIGSEKLTAAGDRWQIINLAPDEVGLDISDEDFTRINSLLGPGPGTGPRFTEVNVYGPDADLPGWGKRASELDDFAPLWTPTPKGRFEYGKVTYIRRTGGAMQLNFQLDPDKLRPYFFGLDTEEKAFIRAEVADSIARPFSFAAFYRSSPPYWPSNEDPETGLYTKEPPPEEFAAIYENGLFKVVFAQ